MDSQSTAVANRIAVLDQANIIACGTADELAKSDHPLVRALVSSREKSTCN
jgi:ABC-type transporter Mla maintaining outer membrane lipid asymmetry ATPase subunit MlaF